MVLKISKRSMQLPFLIFFSALTFSLSQLIIVANKNNFIMKGIVSHKMNQNKFYFTQPENAVMFDKETAKVVYRALLNHTHECALYVKTLAEEVSRSVHMSIKILHQELNRASALPSLIDKKLPSLQRAKIKIYYEGINIS